MKVHIVGGGPGGLYAAALLKQLDPASDVTVFERNQADDTFGFGVVFSDAELDKCVESSIFAVYDNAGQDCCSRSRILVERAVYDEFVERFATRAQAMSVGDTADEATEMGPLISPEHREKVEAHISAADSEGA